jgi:hypothetical protein
MEKSQTFERKKSFLAKNENFKKPHAKTYETCETPRFWHAKEVSQMFWRGFADL